MNSQLTSTNPADEFHFLEQVSHRLPQTFSQKVIGYPTATNFHNQAKNRYDNILPKEETRVCLNKIDQIPGSDYINANYVSFNNSTYICCQAPLPSTFGDFWRMIWEQQVSIIIMLTELICPNGQEKADCYWPSKSEKATQFDNLTVWLMEEIQEGGITVRKFQILSKNGEQRILSHLQYTGWPDFSVPSSAEEFRLLLKLTDKLKDNSLSSKGTKRPIVVHCSAGVGRTGVFVAARITLKLAKEGVNIPVFYVVQCLREQRTGMVQSLQQYLFLHSFVMSARRSITKGSGRNDSCSFTDHHVYSTSAPGIVGSAR